MSDSVKFKFYHIDEEGNHPAANLLYNCYNQTGQPEQAELIQVMWTDDDNAVDAALEKISDA